MWQIVFEQLGLKKIPLWLEDGVKFYYKPKLFFTLLFKRKPIDIFKQVLFYHIILIGFIAILSGTNPFFSSIKYYLSELVFLFIFNVVPIFLSFLILRIFFLFPIISFSKIVCYVILCKCLFAPIQLILYFTFIVTENYNFLFLFYMIGVILMLYITIYISVTFFNKAHLKIIGIILIFILTNLLVPVITKVSIDDYAGNIENSFDKLDPIKLEFNLAGEKLYLVDTYLYKIIIDEDSIKTNMSYEFVRGNDTIKNDTSYQTSYFYFLQKQLKYTDSIIPTLRYQRNIDFYKECNNYFKSVDKEIYKDYKREDAKDQYLIINRAKNSLVAYRYIFITPDTIWKQQARINNNVKKFYSNSETANSPFIVFISLYLYPSTCFKD